MSKNKPFRLVIDTNLWISFIISKRIPQLEPFLIGTHSKILFSSELIEEIEATIKKPKLKKYFPNNALEEMLTVFDPYIEFIDVKSRVALSRDPNDDFLLALAKDGKADFLITGDKDLLDLKKFGKTQILRMVDFIDKNS